LGVGMGNYKDSKLEALAKKGNGNFAYLDDEREAEKVLVKELTQTLYSVADDVYMNINFNAAYVKDYRLIGFDNKLNAVADSLSELEGGEVGSGHTLMALFEITPTLANEHISQDFANNEKLASIRFNFKIPHDAAKKQTVYAVPFQITPFDELPACHRFATSVVMFGSLLKNSKYTKAINWNDAIIMANESLSPGDFTQKEFLTLVEKAKKIYGRGKKKKDS
jgi:Ca-activated chloride channel homolog